MVNEKIEVLFDDARKIFSRIKHLLRKIIGFLYRNYKKINTAIIENN